ncbi:glycosyltransferase [Chloroflexota bacterium]
MTTGIKPRIAMLSVHSCPLGNLGARDTGGMSVYIREMAVEMGKLGFSVDIYTRLHDPNDEPVATFSDNVRLLHLKVGEEGAMDKLAVYHILPEFVWHLENFRKNGGLKYDLVFSHYWLSAWVGQYLKLLWQVPHVVMFHTLGAVKNAIGIGEDEPELRLIIEGYLAKHCNRIVAATKQEKEELMQRYGTSAGNITVIPCGVDLDLFRPRDKKAARQQLGWGDAKILLFVGRIVPLKGLDQLLKAMVYLRNNHQLRLVIAGGDEHNRYELERLKRLSQELRIDDLITFLGLVEHKQLPFLYSAVDICVVPSHHESFGLVALESMACGTPVVTTNVGDLEKIIHQGVTGYIAAENTPSCLAENIALLLSASSSTIGSVEIIRASVTRFSWLNIARQMIEELQRLLVDYSTVMP